MFNKLSINSSTLLSTQGGFKVTTNGPIKCIPEYSDPIVYGEGNAVYIINYDPNVLNDGTNDTYVTTSYYGGFIKL